MKLLKQVGIVFLGLFALALAGCSGGGDDGSGVQSTSGIALVPGGIVLTGPTTVSFLDITATKLVLLTNGEDKLTFTLAAKDQNRVAVAGETILVSSTGGTLAASALTTDDAGLATVDLLVGTEKTNRQITVTFTAGGLIKTQAVTISGTTLSLTASNLTTTPSDPSPIEFIATLKDAGSNPVGGAQVTFTSTLGNTFTASPGYAFTSNFIGTTDANGVFKANYVGTNVGTATVTVSANGVTPAPTAVVTVEALSQAAFGFTAPLDNTIVNVGGSQLLTVEYLDPVGAGVADTLTFTTIKGSFDPVDPLVSTVDVPTVGGVATVTYYAGNISGPAEIGVIDSTKTRADSLTLDVRATVPASISLQASPSVVPVNVGGVEATSTLTATVRDANNQAVAGKLVVFTILAGPGGGMTITPGMAVTDVGGNASVTFVSGTAVSAQDGVVVQAAVSDGLGGLLTDTTNLTIGQKAATITIGTSNKIRKVTIDGVEVAYALPFSVTVVDANSNPIQGAVVSLGLFPVRFYTGTVNGAGNIQSRDGVFLNEDINRNNILELGEDGAIELDPTTMAPFAPVTYWNSGAEGTLAIITTDPVRPGNGRLDPAGVATIPTSVTTGDLGLAGFEVIYSKSYGSWVDVEISASTQVTGTTSVAKIEAALAVATGDIPFPWSPFGYKTPPP